MATTETADEPWAAQRDASWYNRPNTRTDKVVHVAGKPSLYGQMSRCGRSVLNEDLMWSLEGVPEHVRCQGSGCRQAWPVATRTASDGRHHP
ncbi:hypothetical protein OG455_41725 [Kitasatospora sp. NBC_01287]|uniref:hypothetical protein n=1 Tax=Kitasatospora sp. NBC_01287 TaxID=2903573 RepID=UPI00225576A0|nr:hypothetical protein [Kitasatospora sp. NBC_01287]MCX4751744.1 hypothetical protein [Kitasatospora sp. NBC_01287]MCX4751964.1 hypothetical protein [Kitasatospora sp. NBC_01287]